MKTLKNNLRNLVTTALLIGVLLINVSCKERNDKPNSEQVESTVTKSEVKAPAEDIVTATFLGNLKTVEQHINAGSDLNKRDDYGSTPLMIAVTFGKTDVAKALISGGANLNLKAADGSTALHTAAFFCRTEIVEALINAKADKNVKNNYGSTALESVLAPFETVKPIYEQLNKDLGPFGLKLNYEQLEKTRPIVANLLK
jgi:ankyrin repeat protein